MSPNVGLFPLYTPDEPTVDIIAVHGLNGDAFTTWTNKAGRCWLRDLLPHHLRSARILTFGYDARVLEMFGKTSADGVLSHAQALVAELASNRQVHPSSLLHRDVTLICYVKLWDAERRPIIFICHSLGGIVLKRALIYARTRSSKSLEHLHSVFVSTYGILFLGTPHEGSSKAKVAATTRRIIDALVPKQVVSTSPQLLEALHEHSRVLQDITTSFAPLMKDFEICFYWEQLPTKIGPVTDYIVPESSAAPVLEGTGRGSIGADHRNMCRFDSQVSPGFSLVVGQLVRYVKNAVDGIGRHWAQADDESKIRQEYRAAELAR